MSAKLSISQISLILISLIIVLYSILLVRYDKWVFDLFYFFHLFSLFMAIDFIFYINNCSQDKGKSHYVFCTFPLTRLQVLYIELKNYYSRWELKVFILSILFFISVFFLLNNKNFLQLIILLVMYSVQLAYLIIIFFIIKNLVNNKKLNSDLKSIVSSYISLMIFIVVLSDKNSFFKTLFLLNPLSNGFLAYLITPNFGIWGTLISMCFFLFIVTIAKKIFKVWDLY
jgi:hypothetical protein